MTEYDLVNHPKHYTQYEHEVIELTEQLGFCLGNAVKYILRAKYKGREVEDLRKAQWYLKRCDTGNRGEAPVYQQEIIDLALTYKNPVIDILFSYCRPCEAAFEKAHEEIDRVIAAVEVAGLKDELAKVTAERDRLKAELSAERLKAHLGERSIPDFKGPYEVTMDADGKTMDIEHGC